MKSFCQYAFLLFIVIGFSSCTKSLDINIPQAKQKLAVFSQIIPNEIVMVGVTRSFSALNDFFDVSGADTSLSGILVGRAFVTIRQGNARDTLSKLADGLYGSANVNLQPNTTCELYVYDSTSGETVRAVTQVKPLVKDTLTVHIDKTQKDTLITFKLRIEDDPSTEDYYYIDIASDGQGVFLNQAKAYFNRLSLTSTVDIISDKEAVNGWIEKEYANSSFTSAIGPNDSVTVVVANVSESYYRFVDAYKRGNSLFTQIFGEPVNYPSNVINGYGLFTAHLPKIYFLDMKDY